MSRDARIRAKAQELADRRELADLDELAALDEEFRMSGGHDPIVQHGGRVVDPVAAAVNPVAAAEVPELQAAAAQSLPRVPEVSTSEAAVLGGLDKATFGHASQLSAAVEAPFSDKTYGELEGEKSQLANIAATQHPDAYRRGGYAGSALNPALVATGALGAGAAAGVGAAGIVPSVVGGAAGGALQGGVEDGAQGALIGGAMGAGMGAAVPLAYQGASNLAQRAAPVIGAGARKVWAGINGVPDSALARDLARPAEVDAALAYPQLAEGFRNTLDQGKRAVNEAAQYAEDALLQSPLPGRPQGPLELGVDPSLRLSPPSRMSPVNEVDPPMAWPGPRAQPQEAIYADTPSAQIHPSQEAYADPTHLGFQTFAQGNRVSPRGRATAVTPPGPPVTAVNPYTGKPFAVHGAPPLRPATHIGEGRVISPPELRGPVENPLGFETYPQATLVAPAAEPAFSGQAYGVADAVPSGGFEAAARVTPEQRGMIDPGKAQSLLQAFRESLNVNGTQLDSGLNNLVEKYSAATGAPMSQPDARKLLKGLREVISSTAPGKYSGPEQQAASKLRYTISEQLKALNPEYAERMVPLAEKTRALGNLSENIGTRTDAQLLGALEKNFGPRAQAGKTEDIVQMVTDFDKQFGTDLANQVQDTMAKHALSPQAPTIKGLLRGGLVGSAASSVFGPVAGMAIGSQSAFAGGPVARAGARAAVAGARFSQKSAEKTSMALRALGLRSQDPLGRRAAAVLYGKITGSPAAAEAASEDGTNTQDPVE
jgi:hypothetical protein